MTRHQYHCRCGATFATAIGEARHRHNFPILCRRKRRTKVELEKLLKEATTALTWAVAEIEFRTRYVDAAQRQNALNKVKATLGELGVIV